MPYTVDARDLVDGSAIMSGLTPGVTRVTNRDLATFMVAVSDNSATNVLIDRVGMQNVNALLDSLGLHQTRLQRKMMDVKAAQEGRENISTPNEMMTLFGCSLPEEGAEQGADRGFFQSVGDAEGRAIFRGTFLRTWCAQTSRENLRASGMMWESCLCRTVRL